MNRLTINQVTACVNSATRVTKESVAIDYDTLTQALNAALDSDLTGLPEAHQVQWCDVNQPRTRQDGPNI
jgi:hypothetical protein